MDYLRNTFIGSVFSATYIFCVLCTIKVAGLYSAMLDIYFPIALFSRAPKYFSRRAPYRVVPVLGDGGDWRVGEAKATQHETRLEEILRQMFLTDTALQQEDSGLPQIQLVRLAIRKICEEVGPSVVRNLI